MQRQHLRIAMLTGDLVRLLDRLLRLNCELVPTNCHLCTPLLIPINYLSASRVACCSLIDLAEHSDASLAEAKRRKMNCHLPPLDVVHRSVNFLPRLALQRPLAATDLDLLRLGFSALCQRDLQNDFIIVRLHLLPTDVLRK